jgi:hypothetical protein
VYNICSGKQYKIRDIVEQVHKQIESSSTIEFSANLKRTSTYSYVCGDRRKIDAVANIPTQISLNEGLVKTITYYKVRK